VTDRGNHPHLLAVWVLVLVVCLTFWAVVAWAAVYAWGRWG
jgi:hypothetical protein